MTAVVAFTSWTLPRYALALEAPECQSGDAMPTYVYKFVDTGETVEVQQSFDEPALTEAVHPVDGTVRPVKKVFTPIGVTFKGGGFYKTDSAGSKSSSGSNSSTSSSSSSSSGSDSSGSSDSSSGASSSGSSTSAATGTD
jgi:predicted nucleic acid-binding Zn ribbon protein